MRTAHAASGPASRIRVAALAWAGVALLDVTRAGTARGQELPLAEVDLEGQHYSAQRAGTQVVVVPAPMAAILSRDPTFTEPDCAALDARLSLFSDLLEACRLDPAAEPCALVAESIESARYASGSALAPSLEQLWFSAARWGNLDAARGALAAQLPNETIVAPRSARGLTTRGAASIRTIASGRSWASRLAPELEFDPASLSYDANVGAWRTRDQLLACGLLVREVTLEWNQSTELTLGSNGPELGLTRAQWGGLYDTLAALDLRDSPSDEPTGVDPPSVERALAVGAALADAARTFNLDNADFGARALPILETLYADAELGALQPRTIVNSVDSPLTVTLDLPWTGAVSENLEDP
jgi:hypothetical protein